MRATGGDKEERRPREVRGRGEERARRAAAARAIRDREELHRSIICASESLHSETGAREGAREKGRWRVTRRRWGTVELRNLWSHPAILSGSPYAYFPRLLLVPVHTEYPVEGNISLSLSLSLYGPIHLLTTSFIGLAYQGKNIVFRFIIEYSSLRDFYRPLGM